MYELPENGLDGLDVEALSALEQEGLAAFRDLNITEDSGADDIAEAERIVAAVREVRAAIATAHEEQAERAARAAALIAEAGPEPEPVVEAAAEPEPVAEPTPEPVAAAAAPPPAPVVKAAAAAPVPVLPKESAVFALTAAADVPGFATGSAMDDLGVAAQAVLNRMRSFPTSGHTPNVFNRYGTVLVTKRGYDGLSQDDFRDDEDLLRYAASTERLSGGSLTAAGGWCAPSETLYDWCGEETADALLSIPEINVTRGGIRFTKGPDFSDIFANVGFHQTEAQAIAGTPDKTCYTVECPAFTEVRCEAQGVCIKAPILTNAGYPELVRDVIAKSLVAHELKINSLVLAKIVAALGTALTPANQGSTVSTLESLTWVVESLRQKYGFSDGKTFEVVLPKWGKQSIREDLARRNGNVAASVTDAQISAWFSERNLYPQFVRGLADLDVSTDLQVKPPAAMKALVYPAGSFVKGTSAVISLDSVYDSTDLVKNIYTALFAEECVLLANRCYGGAAVTIPVCDSGRSGAADLYACFGTAEPAEARPAGTAAP